jgi:hypothetical protein
MELSKLKQLVAKVKSSSQSQHTTIKMLFYEILLFLEDLENQINELRSTIVKYDRFKTEPTKLTETKLSPELAKILKGAKDDNDSKTEKMG